MSMLSIILCFDLSVFFRCNAERVKNVVHRNAHVIATQQQVGVDILKERLCDSK
jgi:hypothetical protein